MAISWVFYGLTVLILSVTIMAQWFVWMVLSMSIGNGWGLILFLPLFAAQLLLFFSPKKSSASCDIPRNP